MTGRRADDLEALVEAVHRRLRDAEFERCLEEIIERDRELLDRLGS